MSRRPSPFERHPRVTLAVFYLLLIGLLAWLVTLDWIPGLDGEESYSIADELYYLNQTRKARFIVLRERHPLTDQQNFPPGRFEYLEHRPYRLRTDQEGFVVPSAIHARPDLKVVFIGGSTTEAEFVDEEERFPYLVGRTLEGRLGRKVNSYNAGRTGNNTLHDINILVNKVLPLGPDVVVLMENVNDLSTLIYDGSYWNHNKSRSHLIGQKRNRKGQQGWDEWADSTRKDRAFDPAEQARILRLFRENLELFIQIARAKGAIPVLMTQANRIEDDPAFDTGRGEAFSRVYRDLYIRFNETIRATARAHQIALVDLAHEVPASPEYLYDVVHVTGAGSRKIAAAVSKALETLLRSR